MLFLDLEMKSICAPSREKLSGVSHQVRLKSNCSDTENWLEQGRSQRLYHIEAHQKKRINRYLAFHIANNKGADQTMRMRRLGCAFDVPKQ